MHGMLIGLFWFLQTIYIDIGSAIILVFQYRYVIDEFGILPCMRWLLLLVRLIAIFGLIVYVSAAH